MFQIKSNKSNGTYNAAGICPAIVKPTIARDLWCCEIGNDRVSSAVKMPRISDWLSRVKKKPAAHKRVTRPTRMRRTQPRLMSPRSVNIVPESLSTSRRGSGRWRSSSGSGLSMFQFEGSADSENCGEKLGVVRAELDGGGHGERRTLSTSDLVEPSYRESS